MKKSIILFLVLLLSDACVDRLNFDLSDLDNSTLIVEGLITDQPGPYTITLFTTSDINGDLSQKRPIIAKEVSISDDKGIRENLSTRGSGFWETKPDGLRGEVGRSYTLRIEMNDGSIYESSPALMLPAGKIEKIYHEFEATEALNGPTAYGFNIFMDSKGDQNTSYYRWRITGVYEALSYPELRLFNNACPPVARDPAPCSGIILENGISKRLGDCTCCNCWVSNFESKPRLSDDIIDTKGSFDNSEVGYVPFNQLTFYFNKYMVRVEQMSLTKEAYEFWETIKDQKEGVTSLFQPAFGKIKTNISSTSSTKEVVGVFYATAIEKKTLFINASDAPISVPTFAIPTEQNCAFWSSCDFVFPNASRTPPADWQ